MADITVRVLEKPDINDLEDVPLLPRESIEGKPHGPVFRFRDEVMLGSSNTKLTFYIPQSDGTHPVWIDYHCGSYYERVVNAREFKAGEWHTVEISGLVGEGGARFDARWRYYGEDSDWTSQHAQMWPEATFDSRLIIADGELRGTARGQHIITVVRPGSGTALTETVTATSDNTWTAKLLPDVESGDFLIAENYPGVRGRYTQTKRFTILNAPVITSPVAGTHVKEQRPVVSGDGTHNATVRIYQADFGSIIYGEVRVPPNGHWSTPLREELPEGSFTFTAQQSIGTTLSLWAKGVTVTASNRPVIHDEPIFQETNFKLSGSHSEAGATVQVFRDLTQDMVGASWPLTGENWEAAVNVPPGPVSLVAITVVPGLQSRRSVPRAFKIRPPKLIGIQVEVLADNSIRFSGTAYPGATVVITVLESSVESPVESPAEVVATGGNWVTTATGWPSGIYRLKAIQKVSDRANGWIESTHEKNDELSQLIMLNLSEVTSTTTYRPIVSGKGVDGAKVELLIPGGGASHFPDATVSEGQWSSTAETEVGPLKDYVLHIRQCLDELGCSKWFEHIVNVPLLAPGLNDPVEDGMSPRLSGTFWPGAKVYIRYSDVDEAVHEAWVSDSTWSFRRAEPFAPNVLHTVTVIQVAAEHTSAAVSKTFTVKQPMLTPVITRPGPGEKVGREVVVEGTNGMEGATLQLSDAQYSEEIGLPFPVQADRKWAVKLSDLPFGPFTVYAVQTLDQIPSEKSELRSFQVVLLPPQFTAPSPGGKLSRNGILKGRGMPFGWVDIWLTGGVEPWLKKIRVDECGDWERGVDLPLGHNTMRARQYYDFAGTTYESEDTQDLMFDVVPAAPFIETPLLQEHVGRRVVVSGFGVPGDTISVELGNDMQRTVVLGDRTWSVGVSADLDDGNMTLIVKAKLGDFESEPTERVVVTGTYLPVITEPAAGRSISEPVVFAGMGEEGSGQVAAWFNPEIKLTPSLTIEQGQWRGRANTSLRPGGNWCRFRQTITPGSKLSDWGLSERFEVLSEPSKKP
jgi:hypothetical protein